MAFNILKNIIPLELANNLPPKTIHIYFCRSVLMLSIWEFLYSVMRCMEGQKAWSCLY